MSELSLAINFISKKISDLLSLTQIKFTDLGFSGGDFFIPKNNMKINFSYSELCDLNDAIKEKSKYRVQVENDTKFRIYIELGKNGLIPSLKISDDFLSEKRKWDDNLRASLNPSIKLNLVFKNGLQRLKDFLEHVIVEYNLQSGELIKQKDDIAQLLRFFNERDSFKENNVKAESIGYLKAAALCEILNLEKEKEKISVKSIKKEKDKNIYNIVSALREEPYIDVKIPQCIIDYKEYMNTEDHDEFEIEKSTLLKDWVPFASNKTVFIAHRFEEKELVKEIKDALEELNFDWKEGKVKDCGYITDDILNKVKSSGFFLALITPLKEFKK